MGPERSARWNVDGAAPRGTEVVKAHCYMLRMCEDRQRTDASSSPALPGWVVLALALVCTLVCASCLRSCLRSCVRLVSFARVRCPILGSDFRHVAPDRPPCTPRPPLTERRAEPHRSLTDGSVHDRGGLREWFSTHAPPFGTRSHQAENSVKLKQPSCTASIHPQKPSAPHQSACTWSVVCPVSCPLACLRPSCVRFLLRVECVRFVSRVCPVRG